MRTVEITHPDKVLFPDDGITKADLADYYERVCEWMLPHVKNRPVSMQRFPDGIGRKGFFHKDVPDYFPGWIKRVQVPKANGTVTHALVSTRTRSPTSRTRTRSRRTCGCRARTASGSPTVW